MFLFTQLNNIYYNMYIFVGRFFFHSFIQSISILEWKYLFISIITVFAHKLKQIRIESHFHKECNFQGKNAVSYWITQFFEASRDRLREVMAKKELSSGKISYCTALYPHKSQKSTESTNKKKKFKIITTKTTELYGLAWTKAKIYIEIQFKYR